ncbi:MAG TPA: M1 family aminopeptidase [Ilumatobacteraceae bacterium]
MQRRTGGLLLVLICLAACTSSPGVTATEARSTGTTAQSSGDTTPDTTQPGNTSPATTSPQSPDTTEPVDSTSPDQSDGFGVGDVLFPSLGNPGIDVEHYTLRLTYDRPTNELTGTVHLDIVMTEARNEFSLDSDGPAVSAVTIDGQSAGFSEQRPELVITPPQQLTKGQRIAVDVSFERSPQAFTSASWGPVGWFPTPGGSFVLNEPEGASTWFPCDDHPSDQASFRFELTVPNGVTAVANGALLDHTSTTSGDTWTWQEDRPMSTYTIQVLTGDYELIDGVGPNGLPMLSAVLREDRDTMQPYVDSSAAMIGFFDDYFGPYPLDSYGVAIADSLSGVAMETFGRPMYSRDDFSSGRLDTPQETLLSHELAHQWFGNAVSPASWSDVWLNESFATYGQWMWLDHIGDVPLDESANFALATRGSGSTAYPTVEDMFGFNSYEGGAVVLQALRKTIGDEPFFTLLRRWVSENNGTARDTADFIALANEVAGRDLADFFDTWLFASTLPARFPA